MSNFFEHGWCYGDKFNQFHYPLVPLTKEGFSNALLYETANDKVIREAMQTFGRPKDFIYTLLSNQENKNDSIHKESYKFRLKH